MASKAFDQCMHSAIAFCNTMEDILEKFFSFLRRNTDFCHTMLDNSEVSYYSIDSKVNKRGFFPNQMIDVIKDIIEHNVDLYRMTNQPYLPASNGGPISKLRKVQSDGFYPNFQRGTPIVCVQPGQPTPILAPEHTNSMLRQIMAPVSAVDYYGSSVYETQVYQPQYFQGAVALTPMTIPQPQCPPYEHFQQGQQYQNSGHYQQHPVQYEHSLVQYQHPSGQYQQPEQYQPQYERAVRFEHPQQYQQHLIQYQQHPVQYEQRSVQYEQPQHYEQQSGHYQQHPVQYDQSGQYVQYQQYAHSEPYQLLQSSEPIYTPRGFEPAETEPQDYTGSFETSYQQPDGKSNEVTFDEPREEPYQPSYETLVPYANMNYTISTWNGAVTRNYAWSQKIKDLTMEVISHREAEPEDILVMITHDRLKVSAFGDVLVEGEFCKRVCPGECSWTIEDGRHIMINIEKYDECWWDCVLKGDETIDTQHIESTKRLDEFAGSDQFAVLRIMDDHKNNM